MYIYICVCVCVCVCMYVEVLLESVNKASSSHSIISQLFYFSPGSVDFT